MKTKRAKKLHTIYKNSKYLTLFFSLCLTGSITGCGNQYAQTGQDNLSASQTIVAEQAAILAESAQDSKIDFSILQEENPEIFAWLYIPETRIDYPVLQSTQEDDFYRSHNVHGEEDSSGTIYIELANLTNMCDFNTVLHGNTGTNENGPFADLYLFADPVFFDEHEEIYLYLDGNVLTYEVFAAYERENTSLIRDYDFTYLSGCQQFLNDLYSIRDINTNLREGWDFVNPYHFLITLTTQKEDNADRQFIVVAVLTQDAAKTITRIIEE